MPKRIFEKRAPMRNQHTAQKRNRGEGKAQCCSIDDIVAESPVEGEELQRNKGHERGEQEGARPFHRPVVCHGPQHQWRPAH